MNNGKIKNFRAASIALLCVVCAFVVSACGGGGGGGSSSQTAGVGGTGITSARGLVQGKVTGFGSIYVNGLKFDTDTSSFLVDGDPGANQDDLALGMIVTLEVETENGSYTGKALKVVYDDEIQGPVASVTENPSGTEKTVEVFGQEVVISDTTTLFKSTSFATIDVDDIIEVSGFRIAPDRIKATFIEKTDDLDLGKSEVELRGSISNLTPGPAPSFEIDGVTITTDGFTQIEVPGGTLSDGLYVEVGGVIQAAQSVLAREIEYEDEDFDDDVDDVSLQGVIANYNGIGDFEINGQPVDASQASLEPADIEALLDDGVIVEVEGNIVAGILQAEELELEEGDIEMRSFVGTVTPAVMQFSVSYPTTPAGSVVVRIDGQTVLKDEAGGSPLANFTIFDLNPADYIKVEGREVGGEVIAKTVKRTDPDDSLKLTGAIEAYTPDDSITILGVEYGLDVSTSYDPDKNFVIGDSVQIEDEDDPLPADGIADSVELDD